MRRPIYFLLLVGMLAGYYEFLGPGPSPSELIEDLEWWRPWGTAHTWAALRGLEQLAEEGGVAALVPLGIFWLPPLAMLVWGFLLFRSAVIRTLCMTCFLLLVTFVYYGYMADRIWRFFEWRSPVVSATFAGITAAGLFAPSLLGAALERSRVWTAFVLCAVFSGVFLLTTEVTGTDSDMRFNLSPWPVVTLFALLLIGSVLAVSHCAAGLGSWLAARLGSRSGLIAGALTAGVVGAALTPIVFGARGVGIAILLASVGAVYALVRTRLGPLDRGEAARTGLVVLAAGVFMLSAINFSNWAAAVYQRTARNETATQVLVALEDFRKEHGSYPERLRELVPEFFRQVPRPRIGLILNEDDEFNYTNLGDSYVLEFSSVQWVQCGYSPPYDVAKYTEEDLDEDDEEALEERLEDPELKALLADHGLEGAWNCEDAPPKLW
jgi:hypothetical protein